MSSVCSVLWGRVVEEGPSIWLDRWAPTLADSPSLLRRETTSPLGTAASTPSGVGIPQPRVLPLARRPGVRHAGRVSPSWQCHGDGHLTTGCVLGGQGAFLAGRSGLAHISAAPDINRLFNQSQADFSPSWRLNDINQLFLMRNY